MNSVTETSLNDLSNELLSIIISYLPCYADRCGPDDVDAPSIGSIHALSLRSRRLHANIQSLLYHTFAEDDLQIFPRQSSGRKASLSLFLRTLIEKPELARFVKIYHGCASVCDKAIVVPEPRIDISPLDEEAVWTLIAQKMPEVSQGNEDGTAWFESPRVGNWEAITALTLSLCPNIEELGFQGWAHGDTTFLYPTLAGFLARALELQIQDRNLSVAKSECIISIQVRLILTGPKNHEIGIT